MRLEDSPGANNLFLHAEIKTSLKVKQKILVCEKDHIIRRVKALALLLDPNVYTSPGLLNDSTDYKLLLGASTA